MSLSIISNEAYNQNSTQIQVKVKSWVVAGESNGA